MQFLRDPRRRSVLLLGLGVLLFFALLGALQAFNIRILNPDTAGETLVFTGLTVVVFLLLMVLLMLLLRNILKLYADQSSSALGARLRTRMVLGATLIALTPAVFMFLFSFLLMNRSIDRWFSPAHDRAARGLDARGAGTGAIRHQQCARRGGIDCRLRRARSRPVSRCRTCWPRIASRSTAALSSSTTGTGNMVASFEAPPAASEASLVPWQDEDDRERDAVHGPLSSILLSAAQRSDVPVLKVAGQEYAVGMAATASGKMVVAALPMPQGLSQTTARIRSGAAAYWQLFRTRNSIRTIFFLMQLLITVFVFFSSLWLAMFLSKQITRPVEALGEAMDEIAAGKYDHRVAAIATGEMGDLVQGLQPHGCRSRGQPPVGGELFGATHRGQPGHRRAPPRTRNHRRDHSQRRGHARWLGHCAPGQPRLCRAHGTRAKMPPLQAKKSNRCCPPSSPTIWPALIRRGHRMGAASTEIEFHARGRTIHLAVTSARLELTRGQTGNVLVVEDTTELLRAQRQLAWKEVAQRVAHEIKNPLTPIALSAERIGRHLDRGQPDSPNVIRKCSEVILTCVGTLRSLVDQFSALAQFPAPQPRACDMNQVVEEALALFAGRLEGITVQRNLEPGLPPVLADPEALRRALANLIDNAAEAMQGSLLRVLGIRTALSEDGGAVEVTVSDTGHGLTDEIRERLFLPFYSTKHRGTGLGLSIAAKIVQEHGGSIRAESNSPKGARFLLRLPLMEAGRIRPRRA